LKHLAPAKIIFYHTTKMNPHQTNSAVPQQKFSHQTADKHDYSISTAIIITRLAASSSLGQRHPRIELLRPIFPSRCTSKDTLFSLSSAIIHDDDDGHLCQEEQGEEANECYQTFSYRTFTAGYQVSRVCV
jgi:hypothetical protein